MKEKFSHGRIQMDNQKGYMLPIVMMFCTLILFILNHQINLYLTETKFYNESSELSKIDLILQKVTKDLKHLASDSTIRSTVLTYEEGKATVMLNRELAAYTQVQINVETKNKRKTTVLVHYDTAENNIIKWIEGR